MSTTEQELAGLGLSLVGGIIGVPGLQTAGQTVTTTAQTTLPTGVSANALWKRLQSGSLTWDQLNPHQITVLKTAGYSQPQLIQYLRSQEPKHTGPQGGSSKQELKAMFENAGLDPDVWDHFIDEAVTKGWGPEKIKAEMYNSDVVTNRFPGIRDHGGRFKMSMAEYVEMRDTFRQEARTFGFHLSNEQFGVLMQNNVSATEFTDRATAVQRITENPEAFRAFGAGNAMDFLLGKSAKEFYDKWDQAQTGAAAYEAGLKDELNAKDIRYIAKQIPGFGTSSTGGAIDPRDMAELAKNLIHNVPLSKLYGMGLSKQDLMEAQFGGPNQDTVIEKLKRLTASVTVAVGEKPTTMKETEKELNNQTMKGGYGVAGD